MRTSHKSASASASGSTSGVFNAKSAGLTGFQSSAKMAIGKVRTRQSIDAAVARRGNKLITRNLSEQFLLNSARTFDIRLASRAKRAAAELAKADWQAGFLLKNEGPASRKRTT